MMEPIVIELKGDASTARSGEPLRFGLPLPRNAASDAGLLSVWDATKTPLNCQLSPLCFWPDGSIRWLCIELQLPENTSAATGALHLVPEPGPERQAAHVAHTDRKLCIKYDDHKLELREGLLEWLWVSDEARPITSRVILNDDLGGRCIAKPDNGWSVETCGPVYTRASLSGWWQTGQDERVVRFHCEVTYYRDGLTEVGITLHNPRRARHPGGLWDLGDAGSARFGGVAIETSVSDGETVRVLLDKNSEAREYTGQETLTLLQESSGGENWNSRNHINAKGTLLPRFRGFRLTEDGTTTISGERSSPLVEVEAKNSTFALCPPLFWQNFPSGLEVSRSGVNFWLFPKDSAEPYELQGGERKAQTTYLGYGKRLEDLSWGHAPLTPIISSEHYEISQAFPWFQSNAHQTPLDELIKAGIEGPSNFFEKREVIDEYGWRNFGDLFADHETLYQSAEEPPYISHYNNQYDAIYGFARQFALSGDTRWFRLMDDLAKHVTDIDIYHTEEDRAEYNNGLFWHTDHYLDAHTCTHRTFTRHNTSSSTPGQLGGGPAAEHCYTTGLLYHYWMTGSWRSKEAVLGLATWIDRLHQGQPGLLAEILALKKHELPKLKAMLRGEKVTTHRFPFTRGTGNYITALLDAHLIAPNQGWLARAETVIRQTMHPADDIDQRDLLDTETRWSYLVLLASIARYLRIKKDVDGQDDHWNFAKESLLHYTEWMLNHERPFLRETKDLEFANDTWTAQDIRKAMLMFQAAELDPMKAEPYRTKANEWLDYVISSLRISPELHLTRLQIILLQNYGPHDSAKVRSKSPAKAQNVEAGYNKSPELTWPILMAQVLTRLANGICHFRPGRERAWLQARIDKQ